MGKKGVKEREINWTLIPTSTESYKNIRCLTTFGKFLLNSDWLVQTISVSGFQIITLIYNRVDLASCIQFIPQGTVQRL